MKRRDRAFKPICQDLASLVIIREQGHMVLKLVDTSGDLEDDKDMAEEMVAEGLATWEF